MGSRAIRVVADRRERAGRLLPQLLARDEFHVLVTTLDVGDYVVEDRITVERKTVRDFRVALTEGRLFRQAARLKSVAERPVLLLEGTGIARAGATDYRKVRGALASLSVMWYLPVVLADSTEESAEILSLFGNQWLASTRETWLGPSRSGRVAAGAPQRMLACVPGVGPRAAGALLARFETVHAIAAASPRDLTTVPGIGRVLSERIVRTLNEASADSPSAGLLP